MKDFRRALEDADKVIAIKPDWEKGYIRKALALMELKAPASRVLECYQLGTCNVPSSAQLKRLESELRLRLETNPVKVRVNSGKENCSNDQAGGPSLTWNEEILAKHAKERGVLYGTMKIDHPDTPFLVYDEEMADKHNKIGTVKDANATPEFVDIAALQKKLGILEEEQLSGKELVNIGQDSETQFKDKRRRWYKEEGVTFGDKET